MACHRVRFDQMFIVHAKKKAQATLGTDNERHSPRKVGVEDACEKGRAIELSLSQWLSESFAKAFPLTDAAQPIETIE